MVEFLCTINVKNYQETSSTIFFESAKKVSLKGNGTINTTAKYMEDTIMNKQVRQLKILKFFKLYKI